MIKCGHCNSSHETVNDVRICADREEAELEMLRDFEDFEYPQYYDGTGRL